MNNLRWATRKENAADTIRLGRQIRGETHPGARLNTDEVVKIMSKIKDGVSVASIAREYNVGYMTIHNIKIGKSWAWLTEGKS